MWQKESGAAWVNKQSYLWWNTQRTAGSSSRANSNHLKSSIWRKLLFGQFFGDFIPATIWSAYQPFRQFEDLQYSVFKALNVSDLMSPTWREIKTKGRTTQRSLSGQEEYDWWKDGHIESVFFISKLHHLLSVNSFLICQLYSAVLTTNSDGNDHLTSDTTVVWCRCLYYKQCRVQHLTK